MEQKAAGSAQEFSRPPLHRHAGIVSSSGMPFTSTKHRKPFSEQRLPIVLMLRNNRQPLIVQRHGATMATHNARMGPYFSSHRDCCRDASHQFVMLESLQCLFWCRLECISGRRLAGLSPTCKTLAEHARRTEFHRSRKLVATARTGALGLRVHGPSCHAARN